MHGLELSRALCKLGQNHDLIAQVIYLLIICSFFEIKIHPYSKRVMFIEYLVARINI